MGALCVMKGTPTTYNKDFQVGAAWGLGGGGEPGGGGARMHAFLGLLRPHVTSVPFPWALVRGCYVDPLLGTCVGL